MLRIPVTSNRLIIKILLRYLLALVLIWIHFAVSGGSRIKSTGTFPLYKVFERLRPLERPRVKGADFPYPTERVVADCVIAL